MQNKYIVYLHTNKINGKKYVGQTKRQPSKRWCNGKGYIKNAHFYRAILEYGWENFEHKILKTNLTAEEADYWERYYIQKFASSSYLNGYNIELGGNSSKVITEETKRKMSENHYDSKGKNNPMYGKKHSYLAISKMSAIKKGKYMGENNPNYGNHKLAGIGHPRARAVCQYSKDGVFIKQWEYAKLASQQLNCNYSNIIECCKGKRKSCGGYIWKYAMQIAMSNYPDIIQHGDVFQVRDKNWRIEYGT